MSNANSPASPLIWADDGTQYTGLTKRELATFMAMQGLLANSFDGHQNQPLSTASYEAIADIAVKHADAVIARLELP